MWRGEGGEELVHVHVCSSSSWILMMVVSLILYTDMYNHSVERGYWIEVPSSFEQFYPNV